MASYSRLLDEINAVKAIDNHTHMARLRTIDPAHSSKVVQYLVERPIIQQGTWGCVPSPMRNSEFDEITSIVRELYDFKPELTKENSDKLSSKMKESWTQSPSTVFRNALDLAGIEIALVNHWHLMPDLDRERFKHVPFCDHLLYPIKESNIKVRQMQQAERWLDQVYERKGGQPETFEEYLSLIRDEVYKHVEDSAVALKVWSTFFRSLHFQKVEEGKARKVYTIYKSGKKVSESEYRLLQDCFAHHIFALCTELGIPVHFHVGFGLANDRITLENSSPVNLENLIKDRDYDGLRVVLIHGGYPFVREAGSLARMNKNVLLDFSWLCAILPPRDLGFILREWLVWKLEDRILFGTDAGTTPYLTGDIHCVFGARRARKALSLALSGLIDDGVLDEEETIIFAHRIFRENAMDLYNL